MRAPSRVLTCLQAGAFLATGLTPDPLDPDADEYLSVEKMAVAAALHLAESGGMQDAKSMAALMLAKPYLVK